ncbi:class I SAM-dependent methyltransferase [Paenibacillus melissococcoides]|uniref:Class I SAM-dependent methyltransferase n=1 Tax=Paenibacillus melissococcoides TaxID=2912268 RepID=A0ABN8UDD8_9BACL|nr:MULTISPECIES: class I SAM-dependent methyltransferase [Paenibacillus]MEB9897522.1 class I SAM-dependent methyltransferase [Bacillus cereus]GIO76707.1 hypothetical protein J6TS7_03170 [Paenibacillus dendritiformis]CAH8249220.1 class I SAM-dependent methyltransferase [Paenibacillus melissococcoides]
MIVTTGDKTSPHIRERARKMAEMFGHRFVERRRCTLATLRNRYGDDEFIVYRNKDVRYTKLGLTELIYHPSMAYVRIKRLLAGEGDTMIAASRAQPGDEVLDCTAGLGSDALVFSHVVGEAGRVTALESEQALFTLLHEGLLLYESSIQSVNEAMRRIALKQANHVEWLRGLPDRSVDIVYFDPMFREPVKESASIDPLRALANPGAVKPEAIREACRVARKTVVMKELRGSEEFGRLGFERLVHTGTKLAYGVIDIAGNNVAN